MMRFLSTRVHGVLDYLIGLLLIAAPWVLGFAYGGAEQWVPVTIGVLMLGAAMMTDYEYGVVPVLPMRTHLSMDFAMGVILAASPWIFGFAHVVWAPHLLVGLFEIGAAAVTSPLTSTYRPSALAEPARARLR